MNDLNPAEQFNQYSTTMKSLSFSFLFVMLSLFQLKGQTAINEAFFDRTDQLLSKYVKDGLIDYAHIGDDPLFEELNQTITSAQIGSLNRATKVAFYINAYNLLTIKRVTDNYPIESVYSVVGFFEANKVKVAGKKTSLNAIEKDILLKEYNDPRYHFVLVCGALGCPPIVPFAYRPEQLEQQLEQQIALALNDPEFIKVNDAEQKVELSQIFKWYKKDFGGNDAAALAYVNEYRENKIPSSYAIDYYSYDWTLNEQEVDMPLKEMENNNAARYVVSSTIPKGTFESRSFSNLYSQTIETSEGNRVRSNFYTNLISVVYGLNDRFNVGFDLRYRRTSNTNSEVSFLNVLGNQSGPDGRGAFATIGPKIRWAPTQYLPNFSIQSAFWIPIADNLEGSSEQPFLDWDGPSWFTQLFNDIPVGNNFSVFTELDIFIEDIGGEDDLNRFSTPVTGIISYFPNPKTTIYLLASYSPFWQEEFNYFGQAGVGVKYQFSPQFELELLYTSFTNDFLQENNGQARTYNFGVRYNH